MQDGVALYISSFQGIFRKIFSTSSAEFAADIVSAIRVGLAAFWKMDKALAVMKENGWAAALIGYQLNALKGSFEEEELLCYYLKQAQL